MKEITLTEVKSFVQGHLTSKQQPQNLNPDQAIPQSVIFALKENPE